MKARKKNTFFTFIFSFVPGAAEMYMGFMKSGLSILTAFSIPLLITGVLYGGDYLAIFSVIFYIYGFFHARNIATAPDDDFSTIKDMYFWEEFSDGKTLGIPVKTCKKWIAAALILVGVSGIWSLFRDNLFKMLDTDSLENKIIRSIVNSVPRLAFSILVVVAGVLLIRGRKKELLEDNENS